MNERMETDPTYDVLRYTIWFFAIATTVALAASIAIAWL